MNTESKILIVDDDARNIQVLATILKEAGYQIIIARDGIQAVMAAKEVHPDLILLDVMMPLMDGYEACRVLKENADTKSIPVLFLSARDQIEDVVKGFDMGAVDYIVKPPNKRELLARVSTHVELKKKTDLLRLESHELREKNRKIEANLILARKIQRQVMPVIPPRPGVAFHYSSTDEVGGDFFDFFPLDNDRLGIFISDVSGHGVAAAFITLLIKRTLHYEKEALNDPKVLLSSLNDCLYSQATHTFITAFYGIVDFKNRQMTYSLAGHNPPYEILKAGATQIPSLKRSLPLGILSNESLSEINKNYDNESISLTPGSRLLIYTDGLTEAVDSADKKTSLESEDFETARLMEILRKCASKSASEMVENIIQGLSEFCNSSDYEDDVCVICVEI